MKKIKQKNHNNLALPWADSLDRGRKPIKPICLSGLHRIHFQRTEHEIKNSGPDSRQHSVFYRP